MGQCGRRGARAGDLRAACRQPGRHYDWLRCELCGHIGCCIRGPTIPVQHASHRCPLPQPLPLPLPLPLAPGALPAIAQLLHSPPPPHYSRQRSGWRGCLPVAGARRPTALPAHVGALQHVVAPGRRWSAPGGGRARRAALGPAQPAGPPGRAGLRLPRPRQLRQRLRTALYGHHAPVLCECR